MLFWGPFLNWFFFSQNGILVTLSSQNDIVLNFSSYVTMMTNGVANYNWLVIHFITFWTLEG